MLLANIPVTSSADSGAGTLREAILTANASSGTTDTITFAIAGTGVHTITTLSALPPITDPIIIDATTQTGYTGMPLIELRGSSAGNGVIGLNISAGNSTVRGLVVNGFKLHGIQLSTNGGNVLQANYIGTTSSGTAKLANLATGVFISSSNNNTIGGNTFTNSAGAGPFSARNLVSGNSSDGIFIQGSTGTTVKNNYVGVTVTGSSGIGNSGDGIVIGQGSSNNSVGGTAGTDANVISGNGANGVQITGDNAANNTVVGNFIGINAAGTGKIQNGTNGVRIDGGGVSNVSGNIVGGTAAGARNVIAGNASDGVHIVGDGASATLVQGNFIGTNATGTSALANGNDGVNLVDTSGQTVGGAAAGAGNVISGNGQNGVEIQDNGTVITLRNNLVQGNFIGTNAAGTGALANGDDGVDINSGSGNTIGGSDPGARNIISANASDGVEISVRDFLLTDASFNTIQGNYIGTDKDGNGSTSLGNIGSGVHITFSTTVGASYTVHDNLIGGTTPAARNVISNNHASGIHIAGPNIFSNTIEGNYIGVKPDGLTSFGNGHTGVTITASNNNVVGGTAAGAGNIIANNGAAAAGSIVGAGVYVESGTGNLISANSIFANTTAGVSGLGIDLGVPGVTANDAGDGDTGANNLQNFPVLSSATAFGASSTIAGSLNSLPSAAAFTIEFFSNTAADPSGFGEGRTYLGSTTVNTDAGGNATFNVTLPVTLSAGQFVSATATDASNNTSEFSHVVSVTAAMIVIGTSGDDQFRLVRDSANPALLDIFVNNPSTPAFSIDYATAPPITVDALAGDDTLTLDFARGTPIPVAGLSYQGGAATTTSPGDSLLVTGNGGAGAVTYAPSGATPGNGTMTVDARSFTFISVETADAGGATTLTLLTPNAADTVAIDSPAAGSNRVGGSSGGVALTPLTFHDIANFVLNAGANDGAGADDAITIDSSGLVATGLTSFRLIGAGGSDSLTVNGGSFAVSSDLAADTANLTLNVNTDGVGSATVTLASSQHLAGVNVGAGGSLSLLADGGTRVLATRALSVLGSGRLDLEDHVLIYNYSTPTPLPQVVNLIISGRNGGSWDGGGIVTTQSSAIAPNSLTTFAAAEASDVVAISGLQTGLFAGETVDATTVIVKYTYGGDANFDGKINVDDYGRIDFNVPLGTSGWYNGDFNYDGKINVDDYGIIDFNVIIQGPPLTGTAAAGVLNTGASPRIRSGSTARTTTTSWRIKKLGQIWGKRAPESVRESVLL